MNRTIKYLYVILISIGLFSCGSQKETVEKTANMTEDINQMPSPGPAPKITFKKPETFTLNNGMRVILVENHKLPKVTASLRLDNQPISLRNKKGSDELLSGMLGTGSMNVSKDDYNSKIDFYGAQVDINEGGFYINSLKKFFPQVLNLTVDQALYPKFTQEEFDKRKDKLIQGLKLNEKSTPVAASRVLDRLAFGKHPYGEITTMETLNNIKLPDVDNYYKKVYIPNHAYLIIVGDITLSEVKKMVNKDFSAWQPVHQTKGLPLPRIQNAPATEVDFVNMPNAAQTEIKVAHRSDIKLANPDYPKVLVMNSILGGDFNSYLNMTLREKHGWTYGARSRFGTDKYGDLFKAGASVRNSVADSAVVVTMQQLDKIIKEKVSDTLLQNTKAKYMGNFVLQMENPQTIARQAYRIYTNNLPDNFYETFLERLDNVTADDVQYAAQTYLHPDKARIIVAGNAKTTVPGLKKSGYTVKFYDKYGNPQKAPTQKTMPKDLKVSHVLDHYFAVIGGKDKIRNIKSVDIVMTGKVQGMDMEMHVKEKAPNKQLVEIKVIQMGMVVSKNVFDGAKGYVEARGQKIDMTAEQIEEAKKETRPFGEFALYKKGQLEGMESIDGNDYYVIKDGDTKYYYDVKTGYRAKVVKTKQMNGQTFTQGAEYSDYKNINGIKYPYKYTITMGPQQMEFTVKEIKFNTVKDEDFK